MVCESKTLIEPSVNATRSLESSWVKTTMWGTPERGVERRGLKALGGSVDELETRAARSSGRVEKTRAERNVSGGDGVRRRRRNRKSHQHLRLQQQTNPESWQ